jgi:hypothetical protein
LEGDERERMKVEGEREKKGRKSKRASIVRMERNRMRRRVAHK